jgi:integrase
VLTRTYPKTRLRHACATLLLERGLSPEDVAIQLGHTDGGALVRRLYGHPSEDRARARIAAAFEQEPVATGRSAVEKPLESRWFAVIEPTLYLTC